MRGQSKGAFMNPEIVALLRSLALRPSPDVAPNLRPVVTSLESEGYVTNGPSGWVATAKGCEVVERERASYARS
jgi:hypothetical protein